MLRSEIYIDDVSYPHALRDLQDKAPKTLYTLGNIGLFDKPSISIIGARRATPYGLAIAKLAGKVAAECGITVVSGGALGCDFAASWSALEAGGTTIICAGTGADIIYPESSRALFERISDGSGVVISQEPWGQGPRRYTFRKRNALIAALSPVLIITEAGLKSGTMTTANEASELGRNLLCVPGSIFSPLSSGTNRLIADGANMFVDEEDLECQIARFYNVIRTVLPHRNLEETRLVSALRSGPIRIEDLASSLNMLVLDVVKSLVALEASGIVVRLYDGRYSLSEDTFLRRFDTT